MKFSARIAGLMLMVSISTQAQLLEPGLAVPEPGKTDLAPTLEQRPIPVILVQKDADASRSLRREDASDQHDIDDLKAQRDAAAAAIHSAWATERQYETSMAQVILSLIGTLVAMLGTFLLLTTFRETKRTADSSLESAKAANLSAQAAIDSNRPWLKLSVVPEHEPDRFADSHWIGLRVVLQNFGNSPASPCHVSVGYKARPTVIATALEDGRTRYDSPNVDESFASARALALQTLKPHPRSGFSVFPQEVETLRAGFSLHWGDLMELGGLMNKDSDETFELFVTVIIRYSYGGFEAETERDYQIFRPTDQPDVIEYLRMNNVETRKDIVLKEFGTQRMT